MLIRSLLVACLSWLALGASAGGAELRYEVLVYFDRDKVVAGVADKSPLTFRRAGSDRALQDEPIPLAINDVVRVEVKARSPGVFAVDQWKRVEVWKEKRKSGKKTVETTKKLEHFLPVNGSLDSGVFLGVTFPDDPGKPVSLKEGANPDLVHVVARPGDLTCLGAVDRPPQPAFTPRVEGSRWEADAVRLPVKNIGSTALYTVTVVIRR